MRCWRCHEEQAPALTCSRCAAVQPPGAGLDHFAALGLPRHPGVGEDDVAARYYAASRQMHPDRFQTAPPEELAASVQATAALNAAYRTLRDVEARGRYWLGTLGAGLSDDARRVPPDVAELVFDLQEKLAGLRGAGAARSAALRADLEASARELAERRRSGLAAVEAILSRWPADAAGRAIAGGEADRARAELARILSELSYLRTLERDVRAGLEGDAPSEARGE